MFFNACAKVSTLLAQTIGVAAALVEAIKTCTEAESPEGIFRTEKQMLLVILIHYSHDVLHLCLVCYTESTSVNQTKNSLSGDKSLDYFEALRISAQQQLQKLADAEQQRRLEQLVNPSHCGEDKGSDVDQQNLKIFVLRENGQLAENR